MSPDTATFKRPQSVLVAVWTTQGEALLLHRCAPACFWQSITGSLEAGETPHEAARRELHEETGIQVTPAQLHDWRLTNRFPIPDTWAARYAPGERTNTEHVFSLQLSSRVPVRLAPGEHDAMCWVPLDEACRRAWSWTNRDLLQLLKQCHSGT